MSLTTRDPNRQSTGTWELRPYPLSPGPQFSSPTLTYPTIYGVAPPYFSPASRSRYTILPSSDGTFTHSHLSSEALSSKFQFSKNVNATSTSLSAMHLQTSLRGQTLARLRIALVVVPSSLLFGYNQSNIGGVLAFKSFTETFPQIDTVHVEGHEKVERARIQGTVVAIYCIACLIGAIGTAVVGNHLGRRLTLVYASIVAAVGMVLQASSFGLAQLIVGRIITGIGVGATNATVPVWQAESSKPKSRGKNVVVLGIFVASGIAIASWINFGLYTIQHGSISWRLPLAIPIVFAAILIGCTYFFPESPRWLALKGRMDEAAAVMRVLNDGQMDSPTLEREIDNLQRVIEQERARERGWKDLFTMGSGKMFYRLMLAVGINVAAQMTGANLITYYATTIFKQSLKLHSRMASLLSAVLLTWKILAATVAFITVDRVGRKPLFLAAVLGMGISMACLAGTVSDIESKAATVAAVFFLFAYMAFFPLGFLGANFLLAAEIGPQDLRVHFAAFGTATHWLCNFVIAEITPVAFSTIGWRYYIVYAVINFAFVPAIYFLVPETKARSLEELEDLFTSARAWWEIPVVARNQLPSSDHLKMQSDGELPSTSKDELQVARHIETQEKKAKGVES
ncbi:hypothetical protein H2204_013204 [Knufia peltigerae]|uniref:Major facilitator superfamily (MFS) profile domain-containing protein n=1 Tax=Knufia peltigerae TaxID=1002370 RepID=A0AA38XRT6_9EURO|nr:hypothetical protein H2204_013204 [Knufia peltigerae]